MDPRRWREALAARIEWHQVAVDRLIAALDRMEPNADLEPSLAAPETCVSSAWGWGSDPVRMPGDGTQELWAHGSDDAEESDGDAEPDVDNEPSLGWRDLPSQASIATERTFDPDLEGNGAPSGNDDDEPTLGWSHPGQGGLPIGWSYSPDIGRGVDNDA
jgi:hypothetical protein